MLCMHACKLRKDARGGAEGGEYMRVRTSWCTCPTDPHRLACSWHHMQGRGIMLRLFAGLPKKVAQKLIAVAKSETADEKHIAHTTHCRTAATAAALEYLKQKEQGLDWKDSNIRKEIAEKFDATEKMARTAQLVIENPGNRAEIGRPKTFRDSDHIRIGLMIVFAAAADKCRTWTKVRGLYELT